MIPPAVAERFNVLQKQVSSLKTYALVDGVQFNRHCGHPISPSDGTHRALFVGTEDEPLAHAGPWLIRLVDDAPDITLMLVDLEQACPSVVWLFSSLDLEALAQVLQLKLDVKLPDGRIALTRFWDPRVLLALFNALDIPARRAYFDLVDEWHAQVDGQRFHISIHA